MPVLPNFEQSWLQLMEQALEFLLNFLGWFLAFFVLASVAFFLENRKLLRELGKER